MSNDEAIGYKSYCKNPDCGVFGFLFADQMDTKEQYLHEHGQMMKHLVRCKACREYSAEIREALTKKDAHHYNQIRHRTSSMDKEASVHGH